MSEQDEEGGRREQRLNEPVAPAQQAPSHERLNDPEEVEEHKRPARGWAPPRRGLLATLALAALAVVGALLVLYAWDLPPFHSARQTTDNAYVRGQTTVIAPQVSGYVTEVPVQDFQRVAKGQLLVKIDDRIYRQRVEQAQGNLGSQEANLRNWEQSRASSLASVRGQAAAVNSAEAQVARARADMARVQQLVDDRSVSLRERDQTLAALRQAEAALQQARAQQAVTEQQARTVQVNRASLEAAVQGARAALRLTEIDLANTAIVAPREGAISEVGVRVGQYVTAGSQLMFLVPDTLWVTANFKEAQTAAMRSGQPARVRVDGLGGRELRGQVQRLAPAAGNEFAVIKPDNATGNFVKVPQRIAVRITLEPGQGGLDRLRPGMSAEVTVDTSPRERR